MWENIARFLKAINNTLYRSVVNKGKKTMAAALHVSVHSTQDARVEDSESPQNTHPKKQPVVKRYQKIPVSA